MSSKALQPSKLPSTQRERRSRGPQLASRLAGAIPARLRRLAGTLLTATSDELSDCFSDGPPKASPDHVVSTDRKLLCSERIECEDISSSELSSRSSWTGSWIIDHGSCVRFRLIGYCAEVASFRSPPG